MVLDTIRQAFIFSNTKRKRAKSCILFHQWGLAQRDPVSPNPKRRTVKGVGYCIDKPFFFFFFFSNTKRNKELNPVHYFVID